MRHLSEFSVSTTAVNNKDYNSEWTDTQIFSITLDTNYNTNDNEITTKLDGNRLSRSRVTENWDFSNVCSLFSEKYSLQSKPLHEKRRVREKKNVFWLVTFRLETKTDFFEF